MSTSSFRTQAVWSILKRRAGWVVLTAAVAAAATFALVSSIEPTYRATARLAVAGRSLPEDAASNSARGLERAAEAHVKERHERALQSAGVQSPVRFEVIAAGLDAPPGAPPTQTISFDLVAEAADAPTAERHVQTLVSAYLEDDSRMASAPAVPMAERDAVQREVEAAAEAKRAVEDELTALGWSPGGSIDLRTLSQEAITAAQREHARLGAELRALEGRRNELDRALADMQRAAVSFRQGSSRLSSEGLTALQSRRAILLGLYGPEHGEVVELGAIIDSAESESARRYREVSENLQVARAQFQTQQSRLPIDHPDVVALAHRVSALETEASVLQLNGLTSSERAYIEGLGRERRTIDGDIAAMRGRVTEAETQINEARSRADGVPALERRYAALLQQLDAADQREAEAWARLEALEARAVTARRRSAGTVRAESSVVISQPVMSRPGVIIGLGATLGLLAVIIVVTLVERLDRRILGTGSIARLQGAPPIAEIPVLAGA